MCQLFVRTGMGVSCQVSGGRTEHAGKMGTSKKAAAVRIAAKEKHCV